MNWENYQKRFAQEAMLAGFSEAYIKKWLKYAHKLHTNNLPIIFDSYHFSNLIGLKHSYLMSASNSPKNFYRKFKIPKKSGGSRTIQEPLPDLKKVQKWILNEILSPVSISEFSKAYRPNRSIKDNARFHIGQKVLLNIDIEEYFHSITFFKVKDFFLSVGYSPEVATMLANLCCLNKSLPQGAPTSPTLSNILTKELDEDIAMFCLDKGLRYTRYADDISISGDFSPRTIISFIKRTLNKHGFKTNDNKTIVKYAHERQKVTGIIVNSKMQVPISIRKELRQDMYYINKFSLESHMNKRNIKFDKITYLKHLLGKANHIYHINKYDNEVRKYIEDLHKLLNSHLQS